MIEAYVPVLLFILVAIGFAIFTLIVSAALQSSRYNKVKLEPTSAASSRPPTRATATASATT